MSSFAKYPKVSLDGILKSRNVNPQNDIKVLIAQSNLDQQLLALETAKEDQELDIDTSLAYNQTELAGEKSDSLILGLDLTLPLSNHQDRYQLQAQKMRAERLKHLLTQAKELAKQDLSEYQRQRKNLISKLKKQKRNIKRLNKIIAEQTQRYERAAISIEVLINTQNTLHNLQLSAADTEFRIQINELARLNYVGNLRLDVQGKS